MHLYLVRQSGVSAMREAWLIVGGVPVFVNQCVPLLAVDLWAH